LFGLPLFFFIIHVINKITEHIPPTEDILSQLGKLWHEQDPSPIDEASVNGLYQLSKSPFEKTALLSELEIPPEKFQTFLEYGEYALSVTGT
jgi:hypothetical protein